MSPYSHRVLVLSHIKTHDAPVSFLSQKRTVPRRRRIGPLSWHPWGTQPSLATRCRLYPALRWVEASCCACGPKWKGFLSQSEVKTISDPKILGQIGSVFLIFVYTRRIQKISLFEFGEQCDSALLWLIFLLDTFSPPVWCWFLPAVDLHGHMSPMLQCAWNQDSWTLSPQLKLVVWCSLAMKLQGLSCLEVWYISLGLAWY